ncbi:MurR/RpiR family transcriptional regulator [Cloacibacillus evryensis]|uniref:MurR/RpiR family transcriptional regulator n=1 Tax=Cloacibacillus evryensis TaxID=508460 RepID=UPI00241D3EC5|nr:MurR/RpiR family transcriptional regulator [Cloacibacillus evryensis]
MAKNTTIRMLQRIAANSGSLSPKQLKLAQYIEKNYTALAYVTMTELASMAGVSETTVVRFVSRLGYKGFPEFMTALRAELSTQQKAASQMKAFDISAGQYIFPRDICKAIFTMEMQVMTDTLANLNNDDFQRAIDMIYNAPKVLLVGCGANTCCIRAMHFALQVIKSDIYAAEKLGLAEESLIRSMRDNAVCVVFTTPRYPTETQKLIKIVGDNNIPIIGISNSLLSPIVPYCKVFLQVPEKYITYIDSNAPYMALIHALTFGVCLRNKKLAIKNTEKYNAFVRGTDYYVNKDEDLVEIEEKL